MKIAGIQLPTEINHQNKKLQLNGAAIRSKFFMQIYVLAFYSQKSITTDKEALESNIERCLRIHIVTPLANNITVSQNIGDGLKKGLGTDYQKHKETVDYIIQLFMNDSISNNDYFDIYLSSENKLHFYKNNILVDTLIENGAYIANTIFGIYMGNPPKDSYIKKQLLKGY